MSTAKVFIMTDKKITKDCICTYPTCDNICRVNKFYAPAKARCPEHGGEAFTKADNEFKKFDIIEAESIEIEPPTPNHKLRALMCPMCENDEPLEILACTETGFIDFGCQGCETIVSVVVNFKSAQMRSVPERLVPLVRSFNIKQVGTMDISLANKMTKFGG